MGKYKEQLILFLNKIKNNRSLQVKIALIVGALLLYHFIFGDIGNRNIEIESITQEITNRDSLYSYSVFLEKDRLKVHEYSWSDLSEKYCKGVADYYKLLKVISFDPMIVECNTKSEVNDIVITDGKESRVLDYSARIGERLTHIKDDELQIPKNSKLTVTEIENKYCKKFDLKLRKILTPDPMKVVCGHSDSEKKIYATNGKWIYRFEKYGTRLVGQNEQYLVREDYSLLDKKTGEITKDTVINARAEKGSYNKLHIIGVATVSKNKRFFTSQSGGDWGDSVVEVDKNGRITKLQDFYGFIFKTPHIKNMRVSDNGSYLYVLIKKTQRGPVDLEFYIIDVKSKSIIFKKTLGSNQVDFSNIFMKKQDGFILIFYEVGFSLKAFKIYHKTKKEN